ncbi:HAD-IIIC family phosphatase [Streptomyces sp. NPDC091371]|uniref:HAD-IIIC family phosphatase n=1 Tax=Streptomyces sp. NPDC091371 TaxID=3155303 RepID=UPI00341F60B5
MTRRCIVVDLDNTLWGGVLGELGHTGVVLGEAGTGEYFRRFQDYLLALRRLAVAGKNDSQLVDEAFSRVPGMCLRREDFAAVVADWRPKSQQIRQIAAHLRLGLSSVAFVDDNPAECAEVLAALPEVDVIALPPHPAQYVRALTDRPTLTAAPPNAADRRRAASYEALARAEAMRDPAATLEEFLDSLDMSATVAPATPDDLPRLSQLVQKTNQFTLTTRRYTPGQPADLSRDPGYRLLTLRLRDRFADHGLVGLLVLRLDDETAEIDSLLLSCRVIRRTADCRPSPPAWHAKPAAPGSSAATGPPRATP